MTDMVEMTNYKISEHCKKRYSERIIGNSDTNSINRFVAENEDKIKTDINKLITYGQCIHRGKQSQKDGKGKVLDVIIKDTWIVLVDNSNNTAVTLYKIDLGCGDDFNLQYISKMMDKINEKKENLENVKAENEKDTAMYKELIDNALMQIKEFKGMIKNLENTVEAYQSLIDNNVVEISKANRELADCVNTLVNKREF